MYVETFAVGPALTCSAGGWNCGNNDGLAGGGSFWWGSSGSCSNEHPLKMTTTARNNERMAKPAESPCNWLEIAYSEAGFMVPVVFSVDVERIRLATVLTRVLFFWMLLTLRRQFAIASTSRRA
jgi:hypothetical protein